jgi:hypothetical protein
MKPKKQKKEYKKPPWYQDTQSLSNALYFFFIATSLLYGVLIWRIGETYRNSDAPVVAQKNTPSTQLENKIGTMVSGYPIEKMVPYISRQDKKTAAFLVGVAKKESNWGVYSPKKEGKECYNYWGYRGTYNQTLSGYSCFDSPKQAIQVVGRRIQELVNQEVDTPNEMVVWKCGWDKNCHATSSAKKWISDVEIYYDRF